MRALVFGVPGEPFDVPDDANTLTKNLTQSPVALQEVPDPQPLHDDWVITRPRLTGICGSDSKQVLLDFGEGDTDNAMAAFCSFPQVMGHEVVADVVSLGPKARGLDIGQRVVLNPWLSCGPRGIEPPCPACENGDDSLCWSFTDGDIKAGIHSGVAADVTGGYAELMPAHDSMLFGVPESVPDELAVFADPSNAFGVEEVEGVRKHAIAHYLDLVVDGRVDLRPMLTHTFRLEQWRDAFLAVANQGESGAVKVAIDQR